MLGVVVLIKELFPADSARFGALLVLPKLIAWFVTHVPWFLLRHEVAGLRVSDLPCGFLAVGLPDLVTDAVSEPAGTRIIGRILGMIGFA